MDGVADACGGAIFKGVHGLAAVEIAGHFLIIWFWLNGLTVFLIPPPTIVGFNTTCNIDSTIYA